MGTTENQTGGASGMAGRQAPGLAPPPVVSSFIGEVSGAVRPWLITFGILTAILGLLVLFWPGETVVVLAILFAIQLIIIGIYRIALAIIAGRMRTGARVLFGITGVLSIVVGVLCLRSPLQTVVILGLLLGAIWVFTGIAEIFHGFADETGSARWWLVITGVLSVIAGFILLVYPTDSLVVLAFVTGALFVIYGILLAVQGFMIPRVADRRTAKS